MHAILNNLFDASDLLSRVSFNIPFHNTRNQTPFYIFSHSSTSKIIELKKKKKISQNYLYYIISLLWVQHFCF